MIKLSMRIYFLANCNRLVDIHNLLLDNSRFFISNLYRRRRLDIHWEVNEGALQKLTIQFYQCRRININVIVVGFCNYHFFWTNTFTIDILPLVVIFFFYFKVYTQYFFRENRAERSARYPYLVFSLIIDQKSTILPL